MKHIVLASLALNFFVAGYVSCILCVGSVAITRGGAAFLTIWFLVSLGGLLAHLMSEETEP